MSESLNGLDLNNESSEILFIEEFSNACIVSVYVPVIGVNLSVSLLNCCSFSFKYAFEQFWNGLKENLYEINLNLHALLCYTVTLK